MTKYILIIIINFLGNALNLYSIYGMFSLIGQWIDLRKKQFDELQRKSIFDSLAYSMIVLLIFHLLEKIIEFVIYIINPEFSLTLFISNFREPGTLFGDKSIFDKIFFDCAIISIVYTVIRLKYQLISKKDALTPILVCIGISSFTVILLTIFTWLY